MSQELARPGIVPPENSTARSRSGEKAYWNHFYRQKNMAILEPSPFARECLRLTAPGSLLFELGCGNGRDALFFAHEGVRVWACDQSEVAIETLCEQASGWAFEISPTFFVGNFANLGIEHGKDLDYVYSRFTLHAAPRADASRALRWSYDHLKPGGRLLIEARSVKGDLYGKGRRVERDAFIHDGHYRRFLRLPEICAELQQIGFQIDEKIESEGLAVYRDDDPVVIRIVASRS
jgi:SAM-dependent methyltransferase